MEQLLNRSGFGLNQSLGERVNTVKGNAMGCLESPCGATIITLLLLVLLVLVVYSVYQSVVQRRLVIDTNIYDVTGKISKKSEQEYDDVV
jgi:hypothetical protein